MMSVRTYGKAPGRLSSDTGTEDTPFFSTNAPLSEYVLHRLSVRRTGNVHWDCMPSLTTHNHRWFSLFCGSDFKDTQLARTKARSYFPHPLTSTQGFSAKGFLHTAPTCS